VFVYFGCVVAVGTDLMLLYELISGLCRERVESDLMFIVEIGLNLITELVQVLHVL
jgi:hypothetical protein